MKVFLSLLIILLAVSGPAHAEQMLAAIPPGTPAPDFVLQDTEGKTHRLSDYRGKPVIINFWATWCPPCREEIPSMNRAWHVLEKEGIAMLAVNMGEDEDTIFIFTADYPADFPILMDRDGAVIEQWPVKGLPTTYIIAPDGTIAYRAIGSREWDDKGLLEKIRDLKK
ncbi:MAG: TlpA family protein disulfide reductase [Gammaproteobacteria bacterium]|nr:MAG: TlpA family protein disulfide reductase [Gammaproteobacteria bacterium]